MGEVESRCSRIGFRQLVADASRSLAQLDAPRLEELAVSCHSLNREISLVSNGDRSFVIMEARDAFMEMRVLARILRVTQENLGVMSQLRTLKAGRLEYGCAPKDACAHGAYIDGND